MPSTPKYPIDIPPNLLVHALHELDRDESERIIGAQAGSSAAIAAKASFRTTQQNDSYQSCSYTFTTSTNRSHREDNRWANVYAFDHSLLPGPYLNASLIPPYPYEGLGKRRSYISSQAPLPQTLPVFYDNVIKHNVSLIVNLTPLVEHGRVKSDEYWPTDKNQRWTSTPGYRIEHRQDPSPIEGGRSATTASFKADHYQLRLHDEGEIKQQHDFDLIHMTSWPDFGAFSSDIMIHLLELIERTAKGSDPVWVHCSAGIGRSGTLIASLLARDLKSSLSQALQLEPITAPSMLAMEALKAARRLVDHERRYRPKMVQTPEQLGMVASVIGSFLQEDVTV